MTVWHGWSSIHEVCVDIPQEARLWRAPGTIMIKTKAIAGIKKSLEKPMHFNRFFAIMDLMSHFWYKWAKIILFSY
jgi:hypothetical protein